MVTKTTNLLRVSLFYVKIVTVGCQLTGNQESVENKEAAKVTIIYQVDMLQQAMNKYIKRQQRKQLVLWLA